MPREFVFFLRPSGTGAPQLQSALVPAADNYFTWQWPWAIRSAARRVPLGVRDKLHPVLFRWLTDSLVTRQELLVTFVDTIPMPSFAGLGSGQAQARITQLTQRRAASFQMDTLGYSTLFGAETLESFWITQTLLMRVPMNRLQDLAQRPEVMYVRPRAAGEGPLSAGVNAVTGDDIAVAGEQMGVANYGLFNLIPIVQVSPSIFRSWIGLLDTGIRMSHDALQSGTWTTIRCGDCVNGGANCHQNLNGSETTDDCPEGHGTSTAAILVGRGVLDPRHYGLAQKNLDSYKVYKPGVGNCGLVVDVPAALRGFEAVLAQVDPVSGPRGRIILAEIAANEPSWGPLARAADHAYDLGRQVLAPIGNQAQVGSVWAPANARKALGVGAYEIASGRSLSAEGLGPTFPDGRIKPDIQAPSVAEAAGNLGDDDYHNYTATSGALPFAGAASALMAGLWASFGRDLGAGELNALLILSGQKTYPFDNTPVTLTSPDHPHGAGHIVLPEPLHGLAMGSCFLTQTAAGTETREIVLTWAAGPITLVDLALWWADSLADESGAVVHMHSRVDAAIVDPAGIVKASSTHPTSVFQRCRARSDASSADFPSQWRIRITGHELREQALPGGGTVRGQKVYWALKLTGS